MAGTKREADRRQSKGKAVNNDREVKPAQISVNRWRQLNRVYAVQEISENVETNVYWNAFSPPQRSRLGDFDIPSQSQSSQSSSQSSQSQSQNAMNLVSPSVLLGTVNKRTPPVNLMKRKTRATKSMVRHDSSEELKNKFSALFTGSSKRSKKSSVLPSGSRQKSVQSTSSSSASASVQEVLENKNKNERSTPSTKSIPASNVSLYEFPDDDMDDDDDWNAILDGTQAIEEAYNNNNNITTKNKNKISSAPEILETPKRSSNRLAARSRGSQNSLRRNGSQRRTFSCNDLVDQDRSNMSVFENSTVSPDTFNTSPPTNLCFSDPIPGTSGASANSKSKFKTNINSDGSPYDSSTLANKRDTRLQLQRQAIPDCCGDEFDDDFDEIFSQIPLP